MWNGYSYKSNRCAEAICGNNLVNVTFEERVASHPSIMVQFVTGGPQSGRQGYTFDENLNVLWLSVCDQQAESNGVIRIFTDSLCTINVAKITKTLPKWLKFI